MSLLMDAGVKEVVIAFDRQFQEIGDEEFKKLKRNLLKLINQFKVYRKSLFIENFFTVSKLFLSFSSFFAKIQPKF